MGVKVVRPKGKKDWYVQVCHEGQRRLRHVGSREAAFAVKRDIEQEIGDGAFKLRPRAGKQLSFRAVAKRWMKEDVALRTKPSTQKYYRDMVAHRLDPEFGSRSLEAITRADIKAAVARWKEAGKAVRSIPAALRTLRRIFSWAVEEGLVAANPCVRPARIFKVDTVYKADFLRPAEVEPYLDGVRARAPRYYAFFRLLIFSGLRLGEALGLEWGDLDTNGRFIEVKRSSWQGTISSPKSGEGRRVDLSETMLSVLDDHLKMTEKESLANGRSLPDRIFTNEAGQPADVSRLRKVHVAALRRAGLRHLKIHSLRATYASLMVSAGVPIFHVSKALGHSDVQTTARHYSFLAPGAGKDAPDVLERFVSAGKALENANSAQPDEEAALLAEMPSQGTA